MPRSILHSNDSRAQVGRENFPKVQPNKTQPDIELQTRVDATFIELRKLLAIDELIKLEAALGASHE